MYLKALEIHGFKSFPEKTRLEFDKPITAIVGPNGSGKSNISDSLSWCLGEQRVKQLRGGKMEDIISDIKGSKAGKAGLAQVSLILDNSRRDFPLDSDELTLTRRFYRSGESEHYINKRLVRAKDVTELLYDTGLGRDGYSLIGQGRVDEILSAKSEDRREVFEEAAGISRFRHRKKEAESKLNRTDDELLRAKDKIDELELQVTPLREQAETAKRYLLLRDELRLLEVSLWLEQLDNLKIKNLRLNADYEEAEIKIQGAKDRLDTLYKNADDFSEQMRGKDNQADSVRAEISRLEGETALRETEIAALRAAVEAGIDNIQRIERGGSSERDEQKLAAIHSRIEELSAEIEKLEAETNDANRVLDELGNQARGYELRSNARETKRDTLFNTRRDAETELQQLKSRINVLRDMEQQHEGFPRAVRIVLQEGSRRLLRGIHGTVSDLIKVDAKYATAIEIALGGALQHIVVDDEACAKSAINLLKERDGGRATFLPLNVIRGNTINFDSLASDYVRYDEKYGEIVRNLLGRTVVVDTIDDAIDLSRRNSGRLRIVTLDGQLVNPGGSLTGGSVNRSGGVLSRSGEAETLAGKEAKLENTLRQATIDFQAAEREFSESKYQLDAINGERQTKREDLARLLAELNAARTRLAEAETQLRDEKLEAGEREKLKASEIEAIQSKNKQLEEQIAGKSDNSGAIRENIGAQREKLQKVLGEKIELEGRRNKAERDSQDVNREIQNAEREFAQLQQKKLQAEMEEKQITDKLWDSYELSPTGAAKIRTELPDGVTKATRQIQEIKREIGRLGVPNIGAIEEYERVNSRYVFLSEQRTDIQQAKNELQRVIRDITAEMEKIFLTEFARINEEFKIIFVELFGGGRAELILEDENDPLNCGVEIKAQPPGKTFRTLSLLSGGERAFVAIALYFAIMRVRPTPFCVLDEIESALDEENVRRFAAYCKRMSATTQFLIITHRRGTMEQCDVLYGVTMQNGVSTVLSVDLEEAENEILRENQGEPD
ncbi:MAG: AAA family ATPase [Oscillospiraceae bacterium]|jgi:chromosome segregation protein|nr:AAA family ATPase [Oscillospiraceae bacterium]